MNANLANQELQDANRLMRDNSVDLSKRVKGSNDLTIRALYHADVNYASASNFIKNSLCFYAPLDIKEKAKETSSYPSKDDVQRWISTSDLVIARAEKLCKQAVNEVKETD